MFGVFQMFGISYPFWILMGCLRFVFETIHELRESHHGRSLLHLTVACLGGVGVSLSLFLLFLLTFGPFDAMLTTEETFLSLALALLIIWLGCTTLGSYLATRIYIDNPYAVAGLVGFGSIVSGIVLLVLAGIEFVFTGEALFWEGVWIIVTVLASFLGGHMAYALNALERERASARKAKAKAARVQPEEVAVLIAAHNEALTIESTVMSILQNTSAKHIYIASDGSTDDTVKIARSLGCTAEDIQPNRGKARALTYMLKTHNLYERYKAVLIMDADLKIAPDYFKRTLPQFDDPETAAIVGRAVPHWPTHYLPRWDMLFTAYRVQLWRVLQFTIRYGQTWRPMNVTPIIPGGSSIYRTSVLRKIDIDVPDLIIEDFNMTFEVHHKRLGKIAYCPYAIVIDQEPYSLHDFHRQISRWYLGFWQTVRRHGIWFSFFWTTMAIFAVELIIASLISLALPFLLLLYGATKIFDAPIPGEFLVSNMTLYTIIVSVFVLDYLITIFITVLERKPLLLVYAFGFFPLRYLEAIVFMRTMITGLFVPPSADGRWKSPARIAYAEKAS
ncbi:MAG TPA: glycosyltransferase family 2 protein [Candidatus Paceibacterota bacterium]|nr:glycosyltransferase family 2 protein [Candidatus Paceibacterota bacterium]